MECDFDWSDVGSFKALEELLPKDGKDNVIKGKHFIKHSSGLIADVEGKMLAALGVKDLVIVESQGVLFICSKDHLDGMKDMLLDMEKKGLKEYL